MNIGKCPYDGCDAVLMMEVPERTPAYVCVDCDTCKRPLWYRLSRIDPMAWTEEEFHATHDVDYEAKRITEKGGSPMK